MHKVNQSLQFVEDSRVRLNCSIASQTSAESQHAVLWYARKGAATEPDELLLKIERTGAFEYGAYAEEERLRSRVQCERLSPSLYGLTLHRAEISDSGTYYCLVEEWLTDPDGVWYRLARDSSGFSHVVIKQPGKTEGDTMTVNCFIRLLNGDFPHWHPSTYRDRHEVATHNCSLKTGKYFPHIMKGWFSCWRPSNH